MAGHSHHKNVEILTRGIHTYQCTAKGCEQLAKMVKRKSRPLSCRHGPRSITFLFIGDSQRLLAFPLKATTAGSILPRPCNPCRIWKWKTMGESHSRLSHANDAPKKVVRSAYVTLISRFLDSCGGCTYIYPYLIHSLCYTGMFPALCIDFTDTGFLVVFWKSLNVGF